MANICNYQMKVIGNEEDVLKLKDILTSSATRTVQGEVDFHEPKDIKEVYAYGSVEDMPEPPKDVKENEFFFVGSVDWSIGNSWLQSFSRRVAKIDFYREYKQSVFNKNLLDDEIHSSLRTMAATLNTELDKKTSLREQWIHLLNVCDYLDKNSCYTGLLDLSYELNLSIEILAEESGVGIQEHYIIDKGEFLRHKIYSTTTYFLDDFKTHENFKNETGIDLTKLDGPSFEEIDYDYGEYIEGGINPWEFEYSI